MLEMMRSKAASWVVKILFLFLILSFAIWGVGDMFRGRGALQTVADVGSSEIGRQDLSDQFRRVMNTMRSRFGESFDTQKAVQLGLLDQTLDQIINNRLLLLDAHDLGLDIGDDLISTTIRSAPDFRGVGNNFDPLRFREFLVQQGFGNEGAYVAILRQDMLRRQITGTISTGATPPKQLVDLMFAYRNERRVADVVLVPLAEVKALPDPDPATLADFHKKNPGMFTAPEFRQITALYLDPTEQAASINVPEQRLQDEYKARLPSLSVPERRDLEQLLFQDEATAQKVSAAIKAGTPFAKAGEDIAKTKPTALGKVTKGDLPPELAKIAFALPQGAVSDPTKSPLGWHVVHVIGIDPGKTPSFDDVKKQIRDDIAREMAVDQLGRLTNQIDDALAGGATLEEAAAKTGARLLKIDAVDSHGLNRNGKPVASLPKDPKFLNVAFSSPQGEVSTIEDTSDGGFFLLRVDKIVPPALKPLDEVRTQAIAAWKARQLVDRARKEADAIRDDAKALGSLAKAAEKHGLQVATSAPFTRFIRDPSSPVTDALASDLFRLKPGGLSVSESEKGFVVGELKSVTAADPAQNKDEAKTIDDQLRAAIADDMVNQYIAALKQRYTVTIHRDAVDSVVSTCG
jgi:peptidyl-prolyl cis-trans isomerase D